MARAIDVGIVAGFGFIFHVGGGDGDPAGLFLGRAVNFVIGFEIPKLLGNRRRQRCLAVVHMPNRADVHVRLIAFKLFLRHFMRLLHGFRGADRSVHMS